MASFDKCVVPVIVVFLACLELVQSRCATGSFYLRKEHRCKPCSPCPVNEIIRTPCSRHHDNICGPFYEFNKFHLEHKGDMSPQEQRVEFMPKVEHVKGSSYENDEHHEEGTYQSTSVSHIQGAITGYVDETHWKELCFGLIGALAVITMLALVYVIVTIARTKQSRLKEEDLESATEDELAEMYNRNRLFSRDRLNTTDYKKNLTHLERQLALNAERREHLRRLYGSSVRILEGNEYTDEVFFELPLELARSGQLQMIPESEEQPGSPPPLEGATGQPVIGTSTDAATELTQDNTAPERGQ